MYLEVYLHQKKPDLVVRERGGTCSGSTLQGGFAQPMNGCLNFFHSSVFLLKRSRMESSRYSSVFYS